MNNPRKYGSPPYTVAVVHGGPGAAGEMAPVARRLANGRGVLEPLQTATTLKGQVEELAGILKEHARLPVTLMGYSWGAWLSFVVAACYPHVVKRLILVSSGPFEEEYAAQLGKARMNRLGESDWQEFESTLAALSDPHVEGKDALLARLGALVARADAYELLAEGGEEPELVDLQGDLFQSVWHEAAALRRSGALLALGRRVACPVLAVHGDHDPHPAAGVEAPLSCVLDDFRFVLLARCGHTPWKERWAREAFYGILEEELQGQKGGG
jgi:pimeloyl-ACP methyl ester carboxylesterase